MATYILSEKIISQMESECLAHTQHILKTRQSLAKALERAVQDCKLLINEVLSVCAWKEGGEVLEAMRELRHTVRVLKPHVLQAIVFHTHSPLDQMKGVGAPSFIMERFLDTTRHGTQIADPVYDILQEFERVLLVDAKESEVAEERCVQYLQDYLRNKTPLKVPRNSGFGGKMANAIPLLMSYLKADTSGVSREDSYLRAALLFANIVDITDKASLHISAWKHDFDQDADALVEHVQKSCSQISLSLETPKLVNKMYWSFVRNEFLTKQHTRPQQQQQQHQKTVLESMYEVVQLSEQLPAHSIPVVVTGFVKAQSLFYKLLIVTNKHAVCQGNPAFLFLVNQPSLALEATVRVVEEADESNHLRATFHGTYSTLVDFISRNLLNYAAENYLRAIFIGDFSHQSFEPLFDSRLNAYYPVAGDEQREFEEGFPLSVELKSFEPPAEQDDPIEAEYRAKYKAFLSQESVGSESTRRESSHTEEAKKNVKHESERRSNKKESNEAHGESRSSLESSSEKRQRSREPGHPKQEEARRTAAGSVGGSEARESKKGSYDEIFRKLAQNETAEIDEGKEEQATSGETAVSRGTHAEFLPSRESGETKRSGECQEVFKDFLQGTDDQSTAVSLQSEVEREERSENDETTLQARSRHSQETRLVAEAEEGNGEEEETMNKEGEFEERQNTFKAKGAVNGFGLHGWYRLAIRPMPSGTECLDMAENVAYVGVSSPFDVVRLLNEKRHYCSFFSNLKTPLILSHSIRYASHPKLARLWHDDEFSLQLVIQVHLKNTDSLKYYFPKSVVVPYQHGCLLEDEARLPNERMEIRMSAEEARQLCEVTGLMLKVHRGGDPYSRQENVWWHLTN